ncbi:MAG: hypothetical protein ACQETD_05425 [Pseudomonadota bacterium]
MSIENIRFIAYDINTAPKQPQFKDGLMPSGTYLGLDDPQQDIDARCQLLRRAIDTAYNRIDNLSPPDSDTTLNVFMAPEFLFRGKSGAYQMDETSYAISQLQGLVADDKYSNWVFVFGSIVAMASGDGRLDEAYNFTLLQEGGSAASDDSGARIVMKELMSGIDFISDYANPGGVLLGGVEYLSAGDSGSGREKQQVNYDGAGIFELTGINWAVELCLDHGVGRLQKSPQLPGDKQVQIQLIPSCGMQIQSDSVITADGGLIFNCDGGGFGNSVAKLTSIGSPPVHSLKPVVSQQSLPVCDDPVDLALSPPLAVDIELLYADGAGQVVIYPQQEPPPPLTVAGTTETLRWQPNQGTTFTFLLNYDESGQFAALLIRVQLATLNLQDHNYFMPMSLATTDCNKEPVRIHMEEVPGSNGFDIALWCQIEVPGFKFEGVAFELFTQQGQGEPFTIW